MNSKPDEALAPLTNASWNGIPLEPEKLQWHWLEVRTGSFSGLDPWCWIPAEALWGADTPDDPHEALGGWTKEPIFETCDPFICLADMDNFGVTVTGYLGPVYTRADIALEREAARREGIEVCAEWLDRMAIHMQMESNEAAAKQYRGIAARLRALQPPPSPALAALIAEAEARGAAREREACARAADGLASGWFSSMEYTAHVIATAIRARPTSGSGGEGGA